MRRKIILFLLLLLAIVGIFVAGVIVSRKFDFPFLDKVVERKVVYEESVVTEVAEKVSPSVVTVSAKSPARRIIGFNIFGEFSSRVEGEREQDIGTGFIVSSDGLVVTNKHVVSDSGLEYKVITQDGKEYDITSISRDPANDLAVLKIDSTGLIPVVLGDSESLKIGQFVIAIGTALGEFRHTVTTGIVSGLGRGITAGSAFEGYIEELDNVIQTDAAINPGNSGGPLLNSSGEVIGINVAVAAGAQNIGFAIPVNVLKDALEKYNSNSGKFPAKAYLGVQYQMVDQKSAVLNGVPQGAYIVDVRSGSPAEKSGIEVDDIITKIDGAEVKDFDDGLSEVLSKKQAGDNITVDLWRNGEIKVLQIKLEEFL